MLSEYLREMLCKEEYRRLRIATGFWDLAGMKLLQDEFEAYFERGGILDLLIGQEPQLRSYQMRPDLTKEERFPDFYIQRDIEKLSEDYQPIVRMLLKYTNPDDDQQSKIRIRVYGTQADYVRALPIHESQREVERTDEWTDFEMDLVPCYNFYQQLLWHREKLEVLSPSSVREELHLQVVE